MRVSRPKILSMAISLRLAVLPVDWQGGVTLLLRVGWIFEGGLLGFSTKVRGVGLARPHHAGIEGVWEGFSDLSSFECSALRFDLMVWRVSLGGAPPKNSWEEAWLVGLPTFGSSPCCWQRCRDSGLSPWQVVIVTLFEC